MKKNLLTTCVVSALILGCTPALSSAQPQCDFPPSTFVPSGQPGHPCTIHNIDHRKPNMMKHLSVISVTGRGEVRATAHKIGVVRAGVVTKSNSAREAVSDNARMMRNVHDIMKRFQTDGAQMTTSNYSLSRQTRGEDGKILSRPFYTVSNLITIETKSHQDVGAIVDALVKAGVNRIDNVEFIAQKPKRAMNQALAQAYKDAVIQARIIAESAHMELGKPLVVKVMPTCDPQIPHPPFMMLNRGAAPQTSLLPGNNTMVTACVKVDFHLRRPRMMKHSRMMPQNRDFQASPEAMPLQGNVAPPENGRNLSSPNTNMQE